MFPAPLRLKKPGLFVTGTDTGVGKTVITCAIAASLRRQLPAQAGTDVPGADPRTSAKSRVLGGNDIRGFADSAPATRRGDPSPRVGVCKPVATGCRREREGLVSDDAEALAHFADCRQPLDTINPVRYVPALSPAAAAETTGRPVDFAEIARALRRLDEENDALLIEGVGGLMAPIDGADPRITVLDLIVELRYPVLVVCRAGLGTLNHTAMTVRLLRDAGCRVAGLVINGYEPDVARTADPSMAGNRVWLERMNKTPVLAVVPACPAGQVAPQRGRLPPAVLDAVAMTYWPDVLGPPGSGR